MYKSRNATFSVFCDAFEFTAKTDENLQKCKFCIDFSDLRQILVNWV